MKKHKLLEKAMKDYPKGVIARFKSVPKVDHLSDGIFQILDLNNDGMNHVMCSKGLNCFYSDNIKEWAIPVKQPILSGKCAIQVNNEREFKLLMEHYENKGWLSMGQCKPSQVGYIKSPWAYNDKFGHALNEYWDLKNISVVSFIDFAKEIGIEVPVFVMKSEDSVDLYVGDEYYFVHKYDKKNWQLGDSFSKITMNSASFLSPGNSKAFSTKQAAEKWCYYHNKPKEIKLEFEGGECIVTKDKICVHLDVENGKGYYMNGGEIEPIYEAYKSLQ